MLKSSFLFGLLLLLATSCQKTEHIIVQENEKPTPVFSLCDPCTEGPCPVSGVRFEPCTRGICCKVAQGTCFWIGCDPGGDGSETAQSLGTYINANSPVVLDYTETQGGTLQSHTFTIATFDTAQSGVITVEFE